MSHQKYLTKAVLAAAITASLAAATSANAALLAYEGFDYSAGSLTNLNGGFGWSQAWQANSTHASNALVQAGSYTYTDGGGNMLVTTGGKGYFTGNGTAVSQTTGVGDNTGGNTGNSQPFRGFNFSRGTGASDETTWISFMALRTGNQDISVDASPNDYLYGRAAAVQFFYNSASSTTGGSEMFAVGRATQSSETVNLPNDTWGVYQQSGANFTKASTVNWAQGAADFLLMRIDHSAGIGVSGGSFTNADTIRIWINPSDLTTAPLDASADITLNANDFNPGAAITRDLVFNRLRMFGGSENATVGYGALGMDEFRVGEFFADVTPYIGVPEPTAGALAGVGMLALIGLRRRKQ